MKLKKIHHILIQVGILLITYIVASIYALSPIYDEKYFFLRWIMDHEILFLTIGIVTIFLSIYKGHVAGYFLTIGNVIGIFIGMFLGIEIYNQRVKLITTSMSHDTIWSLRHRYDITIWIICMLISIAIYIIWKKYLSKKKEL
ncbi:MAG: hypothetical protein GXY87_02885 [Tissierellia bacterium]|nr:hypothetical protein [Tissierellia bacterium]